MSVVEDGSVWSWGWNDKGRLGNGKTDNTKYVIPVRISLKGKAMNISSMSNSTIVSCEGTSNVVFLY